ncbi:Quinolinate phosphoribosyl transferase [Clostridium autoethanogenum]|uniref:Nicotinate-nucleotide pyrophosphorylase n=1 Tax=Clostridium autoethanogenum DSM 10061 TaxID=1341692 RepID=A0ABN4BKU2_9CLOT|nr:Quinolinate phosphoribosyl transferase [Clostridium autoethanogenum]AGY76600.1 nicotinate-nucleotide pyrophosphorylase [Clostridium autoethanogenum DSM 10061]ALU36757.1 Quinolinate phosphoribosyl transferase [Clostridium autoethanogenum DSM 10061]OVY50553.1 putative nicotinate-nucleotide pyrophosphorylase [carboxylating] [Clostridium autoethanogenum]
MELREYLFSDIRNSKWDFRIISKQEGIFSGVNKLKELADKLQVEIVNILSEGEEIQSGDCVFSGTGNAEQIIQAEEMFLGAIGKTSGVATAAHKFKEKAGKGINIVCGGWKKIPGEVRKDIRQSIASGGIGIRITNKPFIYLDKNYVRLLGSVKEAVEKARKYDDTRIVVVQLRGEIEPITYEAVQAVNAGSGILMVDTGNISDLKSVVNLLKEHGWYKNVKIAYAGGVAFKDIQVIKSFGAHIVDVGRAIIDAPMLDFSLDVVKNIKG